MTTGCFTTSDIWADADVGSDASRERRPRSFSSSPATIRSPPSSEKVLVTLHNRLQVRLPRSESERNGLRLHVKISRYLQQRFAAQREGRRANPADDDRAGRPNGPRSDLAANLRRPRQFRVDCAVDERSRWFDVQRRAVDKPWNSLQCVPIKTELSNRFGDAVFSEQVGTYSIGQGRMIEKSLGGEQQTTIRISQTMALRLA